MVPAAGMISMAMEAAQQLAEPGKVLRALGSVRSLLLPA